MTTSHSVSTLKADGSYKSGDEALEIAGSLVGYIEHLVMVGGCVSGRLEVVVHQAVVANQT